MTRWIIALVAALLIGFLLGRQSPEELVESLFPATPREGYVERLADSGLLGTALGRQWTQLGESVLRDAPVVAAPFRETGYLDPAEPQAVAYRFAVRAGQRLAVRLALDPPTNAQIFIDLFRAEASGPDHLSSADSGRLVLEHEPRRDAEYIVRVQPELLRGGRYTLTAEVSPTLAFPVSDAGVVNIQSFWGDPRDGGGREHHGVDIFAPRGTPVVAAIDGRVSRVRTTPRGGKVVWLRDERRGQSLYYAHLDSQLVASGAMVRKGDTLGLVGNSGNARSTPPHLHFGIYRRGRGPVDPLPFVRPPSGAPTDPAVPLAAIGGWRRAAVDGTRLRAGPATDAAIVAELEPGAPLRVLAATGDWYRVRAPGGAEGFVAGMVTEPLDPIRTTALADTASLRDGPGDGAAEIARLPAGETVEVLGAAADHLYVRARGRQAWVARGAAP